MLLTDYFGQDAVDSDYWLLYAPCLFHYCLIALDSTKQLIGEHAKKLLINLLTVLTIQTNLNSLTDQLNDATDAIIDPQLIVYDRKYSNNSQIELKRTQTNGTCHYNYHFRSNLNNKQFKTVQQAYLSPHRILTNMSSAPASPTHQLSDHYSSPTKSDEIIQSARLSLDLLRVLIKAKNNPVWPFELMNSQNYSKKLQSVVLINEFVVALQQFFKSVCSKQRISDKWSQYALRAALNTSNSHYAGRSLQIYRSLQNKFNSTSLMLNVIKRLKDTCADTNESYQGFVVELLLTLKMNASLLANEYSSHQPYQEISPKQKSKSLNTKELKHQKRNKQRSATALVTDLTKVPVKQPCQYDTSLTLNFYDYKWKLLRERIQRAQPNKLLKFHSYFDQPKRSQQQTLQLLVQTFWSAICLLDSDYDHDFVLAIEIIGEILNKIDLNTGVMGQLLIHKNEFRTNLEMFTFKINWNSYTAMQNLLLKGCTCPSSSPNTVDSTQRLLVKLIPYCFKLNFIDPRNGQKDYGIRSLAMNLIALLPTMIYNYEKPSDLCLEAAQSYLKVLKEQCQLIEAQQRPVNQPQPQYQGSKIEQLKNLSHVMNLYQMGTFGKDKTQWTKCVITAL